MFLEKITKQHNNDSNYITNRLGLAKGKFTINHYAGEVEYNVDNFVEKNRKNREEDIIKRQVAKNANRDASRAMRREKRMRVGSEGFASYQSGTIN